MKHLIAISYMVRERAEEVLTSLHLNRYDSKSDLQDAAFIVSDMHGRLHFHYPPHTVEDDGYDIERRTWMSLIDVLKAAFEKKYIFPELPFQYINHIERFTDRVVTMTGENCSILIIFAKYRTCGKVLPQISAFGGIVSQMLIPPSLEMQLQDVYKATYAPHELATTEH